MVESVIIRVESVNIHLESVITGWTQFIRVSSGTVIVGSVIIRVDLVNDMVE